MQLVDLLTESLDVDCDEVWENERTLYYNKRRIVEVEEATKENYFFLEDVLNHIN